MTPSNSASETLFRRFGDRHGLAVAVEPLFGEELFPAGHEAELRFRIAPATESPRRARTRPASHDRPSTPQGNDEHLRTSRVRGPRLLPIVADGVRLRARPHDGRRGRHRVPGLLRRGRCPQLRPQPPGAHRSAAAATSAEQGFIHALDISTTTKRTFMERFEDLVLQPRALDYKIQFPGPTGTNAVEAALKLARKATGRHRVVGFTNGFHGMTLGALAVTGNAMKRGGAGVQLERRGVDAVRQLPRRRHGQPPDPRGHDLGRLERPRRARRRHRGDDAGRGRHQPGLAPVDAEPGRHLQAPRHPAHRRRHPGRLRAHRPLLLLRGDGRSTPTSSRCRSRSPARVCRWRWSCSSRSTTCGPGRAQRHLPRQQRRLRHRHRRARALLERRRARRGRPRAKSERARTGLEAMHGAPSRAVHRRPGPGPDPRHRDGRARDRHGDGRRAPSSAASSSRPPAPRTRS